MANNNNLSNSWMLGLNLSGAEYGNPSTGVMYYDYIYPTNDELDHFAAEGAKIVRIPFSMERLQSTADGNFNSVQLSYLDALVAHAAADGMKVILDAHNYGYQFGTEIGSSAASNATFANFWAQLAGHYANNSNVIFGLMNEPNAQAPSQWLVSANMAISAIRSSGATSQQILVPGTSWDGAWTWVSSGNASVLGAGIVDPNNNFAFEVHQYLDSDGSGTHQSVVSASVGMDRLVAVTQWAEATGNRLFLGEFGVGSDPTSLNALSNMLTYMQQHSDAWEGGTYWAAGPWTGSYNYTAENSSGTDTPQGNVLARYMSLPLVTPPTLTTVEGISGVTRLVSDVISGTVTSGGSGVAKVEVYDTPGSVTVDLGSATIRSDGSWSFIAANLADGTHAFSAIATDNGGNSTVAVSAGSSVLVDTLAPTLTASQSISGSTTATTEKIFGNVSDGGSGVAKVEIFETTDGATVDLGSAKVGSDGSWSLNAANLSEGTHAFSVAATDNAGNSTLPVSTGFPVLVNCAPPTISVITGVPYTGIRLTGKAQPGNTVTVTDAVGGRTNVLGTTTASAAGAWSFVSSSGFGRIDLSTVHDYSVSAQDAAGNIMRMQGGLFLMDTGRDVITATRGASDIFAIMSNLGSDVINGFQAASAGGTAHDVINFSGRGLNSFSQLQPLISGSSSSVIALSGGKIVTLTGIAPSELLATDFRFS